MPSGRDRSVGRPYAAGRMDAPTPDPAGAGPSSPVDVPPAEGPGSLGWLAHAVGGLRWVELELFSLAGSWVPTTAEPEVRVLWASQSLHHGWHAEVLRDRLPELRHLDPESLTVAPDAAWAAAVDVLRGTTSTPVRLAMWFDGVVPALVARYEALDAAAGDVAAPSVRRWVRHLLLDERDDLEDGRRLSVRHPAAPHEVAALPPGL